MAVQHRLVEEILEEHGFAQPVGSDEHFSGKPRLYLLTAHGRDQRVRELLRKHRHLFADYIDIRKPHNFDELDQTLRRDLGVCRICVRQTPELENMRNATQLKHPRWLSFGGGKHSYVRMGSSQGFCKQPVSLALVESHSTALRTRFMRSSPTGC